MCPSVEAQSVPVLDLSQDAVGVTRQLCDIESVSGNEAAIADAVVAALSGLPHLRITRDGDCVIARTELGRAERVIIAGHLDTVPVHGNLPSRLEPVDGEPFLWGRGSVDMKAGVAVQLRLARELTNPPVDLTWMWYDHEEVGAELNGLGRAHRNHPELFAGDFAILGEPSNGRVEGGCNGSARVRLSTHGVRAHSARSWMGENAIEKLAPILERLRTYEAASVEVEGLVFREGLNAVSVTGGIAGNVIPDRASVEVNYRFAPDKSPEEALDILRELFPEADDVEVTDLAGGARPGLDRELARRFLDAVRLPVAAKLGWTDVARFSALGIPAVNFGPGDPALAHTDDERVPVAQIQACEEALRRWLSGDQS